jgi:hypothetical protein
VDALTTAQVTAAVAVLAFVVAVGTFAKAIVEYVRQNALKRFEKFQEINQKFQTDDMRKIRLMLEEGNEELGDIPFLDKYQFLSIHEEIAAMLNSKLLTDIVAFYFCGYHALLCDEDHHFWSGVVRQEWVLFNHYVNRMKAIRDKLPNGHPNPKSLRY